MIVARIYDEEKIALVKELGIDTICPSELSEKDIIFRSGRETCGVKRKCKKIS